MAKLLTALDANGSGSSIKNDKYTTFQATLSATGTAAVIDIEVSNNDTSWISAGTITLSASTLTDGFFAEEAKSWSFIRATLSGLAGSGTPTVDVDIN